MKVVLRGNFIALSAMVMKLESSYTSNLTAHQKALEQKKKERNTPLSEQKDTEYPN